MKYTFVLIFCLGALNVSAQQQQPFTEKIQQVADSVGKIVLHQEKAISDLVNGPMKTTKKKPEVDSLYHDSIASTHVRVDSLSHGIGTGPLKVRNGYRIQVYFGDNSRKGKAEARAAGLRFRNYFPNQRVYISFISPHWLCRVGDFRTNQEARDVLSQIRSMGVFREAVIVKSKINTPM